MENVDVGDIRARLAELLERVLRNESFTLTRKGVPIAVLQPHPDNASSAENVGHDDVMKETIGEYSIEDMIDRNKKR